MYHANVNVNLLEKNVIQIAGRTTINVYMRVKKVLYAKKIIFGIMLHVVGKIENI